MNSKYSHLKAGYILSNATKLNFKNVVKLLYLNYHSFLHIYKIIEFGLDPFPANSWWLLKVSDYRFILAQKHFWRPVQNLQDKMALAFQTLYLYIFMHLTYLISRLQVLDKVFAGLLQSYVIKVNLIMGNEFKTICCLVITQFHNFTISLTKHFPHLANLQASLPWPHI